MNNDNIAFNNECPQYAQEPKFWVQSTLPIQGTHRTYPAGAYFLIDPTAQPTESRFVIVGMRLEKWCGQKHAGVVVGVALWEI